MAPRTEEIIVVVRISSASLNELHQRGRRVGQEVAQIRCREGDPVTGSLFGLARSSPRRRKRHGRFELRVTEGRSPRLGDRQFLPLLGDDDPRQPILIPPADGARPLLGLGLDVDLAMLDLTAALVATASKALLDQSGVDPRCSSEGLVRHEFAIAANRFERWQKWSLSRVVRRELAFVATQFSEYDALTDEFEPADIEVRWPGLTGRLLAGDLTAWATFEDLHEQAIRILDAPELSTRASLASLITRSWRYWNSDDLRWVVDGFGTRHWGEGDLEPEFVWSRDNQRLAVGWRQPPRDRAPVGELAVLEGVAVEDLDDFALTDGECQTLMGLTGPGGPDYGAAFWDDEDAGYGAGDDCPHGVLADECNWCRDTG